MIAEAFCLVRKVIRVDAYTMTPDKARFERKKIPFCSCGLKYFMGVDADTVEDQRKLVDKGNVNVTLGIFNHFCRFSHLDGGCFVGACLDDLLIKVVDFFSDFRRAAARHFLDGGYAVKFVPRIDSLR